MSLLQNLANLVSIRNHILTVMNDRGVTKKSEFQDLHLARVKIDKLFVQKIRELDFEFLFSEVVQVPLPAERVEEVKVVEEVMVVEEVKAEEVKAEEVVVAESAQLQLPFVSGDDPVVEEVKENTADNDLSSAIAREKAALAAQGRSNKRVVKNAKQE